MTPRTSTACLVAALALTSIGCQEEFDPITRLTSLRVLGIQSEPAAPGTGETSTLTPLIYTPPGAEVQSFEWSWCPFPGQAFDGYPCLITEDDLAELGNAVGDVPAFDLGTASTATLENSLDPELLGLLCTGTPQQPSLLDCREGFPVQVKLTVVTDSEEITAVRRLQMRFAPEHEPNANPVLDGIVAEIDGEETPIDSASVQRGVDTVLRVQLSEDNSERFETEDDFGEPVTEDERLILSWFTESGDLGTERSTFISGTIDLDDARENEWDPGPVEDYDRDTSAVIVVLRDSRGGITWLGGEAQLEGEP